MVAAREPRDILGGLKYESFVNIIDWNRVLIQAQGRHLRLHGATNGDVCAPCLKDVLLLDEDE